MLGAVPPACFRRVAEPHTVCGKRYTGCVADGDDGGEAAS
jgi:hypothetical protein